MAVRRVEARLVSGGHLGQGNWPTIWVCHNDKSPPSGVLGRLLDGHAGSQRLRLPSVGFLHLEANRGRSGSDPRRKDVSFIVTSVIPMKNDLPGWPSHNNDDLILETYGQPEEVNVEGSRLIKVADVKDQAVEIVNFHFFDASERGLYPCPSSPGRGATVRHNGDRASQFPNP